MSDASNKEQWRQRASWPIISAALLILCLWSVALLWKERRRAEGAISEVMASLQRAESTRDAVTWHFDLSYQYVGGRIEWPGDLTLVSSPESGSVDGPSDLALLLFIDQRGCDACVGDEVEFAKSFAEEHGRTRVMLVVAGAELRYAASLARVNAVPFPVYYDANGAMAGRNGIATSPTLLVVDGNRRVRMAHSPLPGHTRLTASFREACHRLFREETRTRAAP